LKSGQTIEFSADRQEPYSIDIENRERRVNLGRIAIELEYLGINDPLSHLFQYLERGKESLDGIREDLETDIAERLPETPFISQVAFDFLGDDFISSVGKLSMKTMTRNNLNILAEASSINPNLAKEYERASVEAKEPEKLESWFLHAKVGAFLIFESLPIGEQEIAVSRIYRKLNDSTLEGSFVSLYQPSVKQFNELRRQIGAGSDNSETEIDILDNNYEFFSSTFRDSRDFVEYYKYIYDLILGHNNSGTTYHFGLLVNKDDAKPKNSIDTIKQQTALTEIYLEALDILAKSDGRVGEEMIDLTKKLNLEYDFKKGDTISMEMARNFLSQIIVSIARVIHQADKSILSDLSASSDEKLVSYATVSYYNAAQSESVHDYANNVCPTYSRDNLNNSESGEAGILEYGVLAKSFNLYKGLDNFGTPKLGVCIIKGCPSRGNVEWLPSRTIVGGCSICANCHKILNSGKSPEKIYKQDKSKQNKRSLSA